MLKTWKIARKIYVNQDHSVLAYRDTDYKLAFLFNNPHELLMSLIMSIRDEYFVRKRH